MPHEYAGSLSRLMAKDSRYRQVIATIHAAHYRRGAKAIEFDREELRTAAQSLGIDVAKNLGDIIYTFRYRQELPEEINRTAPEGFEWIIRPIGIAKYRFACVRRFRIEPAANRYHIKIPDATPEIVAKHALSSEQALLAKLRYNRLVDIFTGLTTYSLQNHLKTTVKNIGQIEVDELYLGVGKTGAQYILPVEAKGHGDRLGRIQFEQDLALCTQRFPDLICRQIAAQFMSEGVIAMFEVAFSGDDVQIVDEKHYLLVPAQEITPEDLDAMRRMIATTPK